MDNFDINFLQNNTEIALFTVFISALIIQMHYYIFCYRKPLRYLKKEKNKLLDNQLPSVSIIIISKENAEYLQQSLPAILEQKYNNFEVIVVNIGFTEETEILIKSLQLKYNNLYDTFLPYEPLENNNNRKKLALTIGIKAAKNDILLFTEPSAIPKSDKWIESMMKNMTPDKDIVLGYCKYLQTNKFINRIARFDNLLYSLQYLSSAIKRHPYLGSMFNIAYRKELFFKNKGFASFLNFQHSEGIFLNQIMSKNNVAIAIDQEGFIETEMNDFIKWERSRSYYYKVKRHFKNNKFTANQFYIEVISRYIFYTSSIIFTYISIINENWTLTAILSSLFLIKLITQLIILNKASKYFEAGIFRFSYIVMDIMQPLYNFIFKIKSSRYKTKKL